MMLRKGSGNKGRPSQPVVRHGDTGKGNNTAGSEHSRYDTQHWCSYAEQGTRSDVFLVIALVQPHVVFGGRLERSGLDDTLMIS